MYLRLVLVFALMAACTPQSGEPGSAPGGAAAGGQVLRGTVSVVGSAPVNVAVVVQGRDGESARVEGPLAEEIGRLAGAEVEVTGTRTPDAMHGHSIRATDYTVRAVNGRPVVTGVVERSSDGQLQISTADGQVVRLAGSTPALQPGQKVWVQGPSVTTVQVQSFGVIKP
jgi:hypothetical protein